MNLTIQKDFIEIDGKPVFIFGGDLSYCRVPRRLWKERMLQMKAAGLNTVTVYAVWAYHQEEPGSFNFEGDRDLAAFIDTIAECAAEEGYINPEDIARLIAFRNNPSDESWIKA